MLRSSGEWTIILRNTNLATTGDPGRSRGSCDDRDEGVEAFTLVNIHQLMNAPDHDEFAVSYVEHPGYPVLQAQPAAMRGVE